MQSTKITSQFTDRDFDQFTLLTQDIPETKEENEDKQDWLTEVVLHDYSFAGSYDAEISRDEMAQGFYVLKEKGMLNDLLEQADFHNIEDILNFYFEGLKKKPTIFSQRLIAMQFHEKSELMQKTPRYFNQIFTSHLILIRILQHAFFNQLNQREKENLKFINVLENNLRYASTQLEKFAEKKLSTCLKKTIISRLSHDHKQIFIMNKEVIGLNITFGTYLIVEQGDLSRTELLLAIGSGQREKAILTRMKEAHLVQSISEGTHNETSEISDWHSDNLVHSAMQQYMDFVLQPPAVQVASNKLTDRIAQYGTQFYTPALFAHCSSYLALVTLQFGLFPHNTSFNRTQEALISQMLTGHNFINNLNEYLLNVIAYIGEVLMKIIDASIIEKLKETNPEVSQSDYIAALAINFIEPLLEKINSVFLSDIIRAMFNRIFASIRSAEWLENETLVNTLKSITTKISAQVEGTIETIVSCSDVRIQKGYPLENLTEFTGLMLDNVLRQQLLARLFAAFTTNYRLNEQIFPFLAFFDVVNKKSIFYQEINISIISENQHISALLVPDESGPIEFQQAIRRLYCGFLYLQYREGAQYDEAFKQAIKLFQFMHSDHAVPREFSEEENNLWHTFRFINNQRVFPLESTDGRKKKEKFTTPLVEVFMDENSALADKFIKLRELYSLYKAFFLLSEILKQVVNREKISAKISPEGEKPKSFLDVQQERDQLFNTLVDLTGKLKAIKTSLDPLLKITAAKLYDLVILMRQYYYEKILAYRDTYKDKAPSPMWPVDVDKVATEKLSLLGESNYRIFLDYKTPNDETALHLATRSNAKDAIKTLLECGALVDAKDIHSVTSLMLAVQTNSPLIVHQLLLAGANPLMEDQYFRNALHYAAEIGNAQIAKMLAARQPELLLKQDNNFLTPSNLASSKGHAALARELAVLEQQHQQKKASSQILTTVLPAENLIEETKSQRVTVYDGNLALIIPITTQSPHEIKSPNGDNFFLQNVKEGNLEVVRWCLEKFANSITLKDAQQQDMLMLAILHRRNSLVNYFLLNLNDFKSQLIGNVNVTGYSALHLAVTMGDEECVRNLVAANWDTSILCKQGKSPLRLAISKGRKNIIAYLLTATKNPSDCDLAMATLITAEYSVNEAQAQPIVYVSALQKTLGKLADTPVVIQRYKNLVDQIELKAQQKKYDKYIEEKGSPENFIINGDIYLALNNASGAVLYYKRSLSLPLALNRLGLASYQLGDWSQAATYFKQAHESEPNNDIYADNYHQLTILMEEKEQKTSAVYLNILDTLLTRLSNAVGIDTGVFSSFIKPTILQEILAEYEKLPSTSQHELIKGDLYFALSNSNGIKNPNLNKAIECYQRARNCAAAFNRLGIISALNKDWPAAIEHFSAATKAEPENIDYRENKTQLLAIQQASKKVLSKKIAEHTILAMLNNLLANLTTVVVVTHNFGGLVGRDELRALLQKYNGLPFSQQNELIKGNLYMTQDNLPMAIKCYQLAGKSAEALNKIGLAYYLLHEWENARESFRVASEINPVNNDYAINYHKLNKLIEIKKASKERSPAEKDIVSLFITDPKKYRAAFLLSRGESPYSINDFEANKKLQRRQSVPLPPSGQRRFTLFEGIFVTSLSADHKSQKEPPKKRR